MKVVIQKVLEANVKVDNKVINEIKNGLMVLVGVANGDASTDIDYLVNKIVNLRIFEDENGVMNRSVLDVGGEILSISQFTLQADTKKGNRPSYVMAMKGEESIKYYDEFNEKLNKFVNTYPGVFGADMKVSLINDGPTTIIIDSKNK